MTTTKDNTTDTKEEPQPEGIVIRIQPRTVARCISAGLGFAFQACTALKSIVDQSLREQEQEQEQANANESDVPFCTAMPVPDNVIEEEEEEVNEKGVEEETAKVEEEQELVNWSNVEKALEEGVESVDWDKVGESIKKGIESVNWDEVGNRIETWSASVDWDKVARSVSEAFEEKCESDKNMNSKK